MIHKSFDQNSEIKNQWDIGVASWIIQDGNYEDFKVENPVEFALQFYSKEFYPSHIKQKFSEKSGPSKYVINGEVIYLSPDAWILDFGVCAYRADEPPPGITLNSFVAAEIYLSIDDFVYYDYLYEIIGMPPMIYSWDINSIIQESRPAPYSNKQPIYKFVNKTNAWEDCGGSCHYILSCTKSDQPPKHQMAIPH